MLVLVISCGNTPNTNPVLTGYEERSKCIACHEEQYNKFTGSHHDLAMEIANKESVLGNFNDTTIIHLGDTARFYMHDNKYYVYTKGEDGIYKEFEAEYTFGWTPLQQYLMKFPNGSYQVLPYCWDSRPIEEGGQNWFHVYDQEKIPHDDFLFWTKNQQNWNHVCAECHSTNLKKNYDLATRSFNTDWTEIDVSCDACHGPSENHLRWAELDDQGEPTDGFTKMGYAFLFPNDSAMWLYDSEKGNAYRTKERTNRQEIELCARCHSRRMQIWDEYEHGGELMQSHLPEVLEERLYYPDGQIKEEDYVYGSFLQSKMYKFGVTCTDCHDPHSYQIQAPGNLMCMKCHSYEKYDSYTHHFHDTKDTGGSCLDCHMPTTNFMVVDPRLDHSMRVPRPDLSDKLGTPNACIQCHTEESNQWATGWFRKWYNNKYDTIPHYGEVFHAALNQDPKSLNGLINLINDREQNDIVRATAVYYLSNVPSLKAIEQVQKSTRDSSAMVRMVAIRLLSNLTGNESIEYSLERMNDEVRAVRYEAARAYANVPYSQKSNKLNAAHRNAIDEYIKMLMVNDDQTATYTNMGIYYVNEDRLDSAKIFFERALYVDSSSVEAAINLADIYRLQNNDREGEKVLLHMLKSNPARSELYLALGFLYTRLQNNRKSLEMIKKAFELEPQNTYYCYVYGIALNSSGRTNEALEILKAGYEINKNDYSIIIALGSIYRDLGDMENFHFYSNKYQELQQIGN